VATFPKFPQLTLDFLKRIKNQNTECFKRKNKELGYAKADKKTADFLNVDTYESDEKSKALSGDKA
jgi:DUF4097 and DUF4098 domain-containing protein YvlB